jgi:hypothetical protein
MKLEFVKLVENDEDDKQNSLLHDAQQTYKEIYTQINVRGKGITCKKAGCENHQIYGSIDSDYPEYCLFHKKEGQESKLNSLMGKPVQVDVDNFNSLILNEYFVTTKADGERFLMMFSRGINYDYKESINKGSSLNSEREVFFIDSSTNFWYMPNRIKPIETGVDKCLIDGELLLWGLIKRYYDKDNNINRIEVKKYNDNNGNNIEPHISFLCFDILYGPINPTFKEGVLQLGASCPMMGFKGAERWPTYHRNRVLNTMINEDSVVSKHFLFQEQFSVFASPNVSLDIVLQEKDSYNFMINKFKNSIKEQIIKKLDKTFEINPGYNSSLNELMTNIDNMNNNDTDNNDNNSGNDNIDIGNGISTDGLIFTPVKKSYLIGNWSFCDNIQYKWKPVNELTIDFEVGKLYDNKFPIKYYANVRGNEFTFNNKTCLIENDTEIKNNPTIVEVVYDHENDDKIFFRIKKIRHDKTKSNASKTIVSILNSIKLETKKNKKSEDDDDDLKNDKTIKNVMLKIIKNCRNYFSNKAQEVEKIEVEKVEKTMEKTIKTILKNSSKDKLISYYISENPNKLVKNTSIIKDMISSVKPGKELECRIKFKNQNYPYSSCLFDKRDGIELIRIYTNNNRITYYENGNTLLFGGFSTKEKIKDSKIYKKNNIDSEIVLSNEIETNLNNSGEFLFFSTIDSYDYSKEDIEKIYEYLVKQNSQVTYSSQIRRCITNKSLFWKIDITEQGSFHTEKIIEKEEIEKMDKLEFIKKAKHIVKHNIMAAKKNYESGPKSEKNKHGFVTRIDIEYAPGEHVKQLLDLFMVNKTEKIYWELLSKLPIPMSILTKNNGVISVDELQKGYVEFREFLKTYDKETVVNDLLGIISVIINLVN